MRVANAADSPAPAKASASRRENLAFFMVLPLSALVSLTRQRVIRFPALAITCVHDGACRLFVSGEAFRKRTGI